MTNPECLGFIDLRYDEECSECKYAQLCTYIVIRKKWLGPTFRKTGNHESYPLNNHNEKHKKENP